MEKVAAAAAAAATMSGGFPGNRTRSNYTVHDLSNFVRCDYTRFRVGRITATGFTLLHRTDTYHCTLTDGIYETPSPFSSAI
jgi:hypothetical protein